MLNLFYCGELCLILTLQGLSVKKMTMKRLLTILFVGLCFVNFAQENKINKKDIKIYQQENILLILVGGEEHMVQFTIINEYEMDGVSYKSYDGETCSAIFTQNSLTISCVNVKPSVYRW